MFLARDKHHLTDLCHLIRHDAPYIFQEYIKESHGRDVRVVLVGGRVIGSMLRCSTDGRMQSNCSLGRQEHLWAKPMLNLFRTLPELQFSHFSVGDPIEV